MSMPVIVGVADYARWLEAGADSATLLAPYSSEALKVESA